MLARELIIVIIGHKLSFYMTYRIIEAFKETMKILFVQKDFVAFEAFIVKLFGAFGEGDIVIIPLGFSNIEEVSPSSPSAHFVGVHTVLFAGILVIHYLAFFKCGFKYIKELFIIPYLCFILLTL